MDASINSQSSKVNLEASRNADLVFKRFFNRSDTVAILLPETGKPLPVHPTDLNAAIRAHLMGPAAPPATFRDGKHRMHIGHFVLGSYSPAPNTTTVYGVVDIDGAGHKRAVKDPAAAAREMKRKADALGIRCYVECSRHGTGFHVWFFFGKAVDAATVREFLFFIADGRFELADGGFANAKSGAGIEIFPKQNSLRIPDGVGNLVWVPWHYGATGGRNQFVELDSDGESEIISLSDFDTIPESVLTPWTARLETKKRVRRAASINVNSQESQNKYTGYGRLRKVARHCQAIKALIHQCRRPPEGGMSHIARRTLAQTARQAGVADEAIARLFLRQPNFDFSYSLYQVRSLDQAPGCRSTSEKLRLCQYPCEAIRAIGRRTPVAFLEPQPEFN